MIFYNHDREVFNEFIKYRPRTCFLMTQLGNPIPDEVSEIIKVISEILNEFEILSIDANSIVTGRDFLSKIWKIINSVPFGIAVVSNNMKTSTISNIFYEIGVMNALGKETIVVKTDDYSIPSDFIRTEYLNYDHNFKGKLKLFIESILDLSEHYDIMADALDANPNLSIDYWRRAFMISGDKLYLEKTEKMFEENNFDQQSRNFVKSVLSNGAQ